jgi:hypothetical protein
LPLRVPMPVSATPAIRSLPIAGLKKERAVALATLGVLGARAAWRAQVVGREAGASACDGGLDEPVRARGPLTCSRPSAPGWGAGSYHGPSVNSAKGL